VCVYLARFEVHDDVGFGMMILRPVPFSSSYSDSGVYMQCNAPIFGFEQAYSSLFIPNIAELDLGHIPIMHAFN